MKRKTVITAFYFSAALLFVFQTTRSQTKSADPFQKIKVIPETFSAFPLSAIQPTGWLKQQLKENLNGFTGHLDSLVPDLIITDNIYGANRLTKEVKNKNVGAISDDGDWQVQFLWWNSETQSNWWDGYIRTAVLVNDQTHLQKIETYISRILATQDADGYLGIYDKELRYTFTNENGELWSKATLLRGLLAWYEYKKDVTVLTAVQKATDNVLANYPINQSHPFYSVKADAGGLTHGLAFTDVLEKLYRISGNEKYLDYCLFLYKDFSQQVLNEDAQYLKLSKPTLALKGHGVHTYEHLRSVAAAYYASGNADLKDAMSYFLEKINNTTTPSGAPIGDEWVLGRNAEATTTGYEYCSIHELMESYISLYTKTGSAFYGDKIEQLFFNAAQGARHPTESAICYLKTDNSYALAGGKNGDTSDKKQTRYRYSPVHKEAAVCCVPNAGRIGPSYIQNMWMRKGNELIATILGPCELTTQLNNQKIVIKEITNYPYENTVTFKIDIDKPATFTIKIRKPAWADSIYSSVSYTVENDFIVLNKRWTANNAVTIQFYTKPALKQTGNDEYYFMYGPQVLAHPIHSTEKITKRYSFAALKEIEYLSVSPIIYEYINQPVTEITDPSTDPEVKKFTTIIYNPKSGKEEEIILQPMGNTILRQVTFKKHSSIIKNKR